MSRDSPRDMTVTLKIRKVLSPYLIPEQWKQIFPPQLCQVLLIQVLLVSNINSPSTSSGTA